jgi:hypothetical protein
MGDKKELQQLCTLNDVPIEMSMQGIVEGWEGKPEGMLQILFECRHADPSKISKYSVDRRNDASGNLIPETSL